MKIALLNDVHFGSRSDSEEIARHQAKFFRERFFPKLRESDVGHIMILGDLFERRKFINFKTLAHSRENFFDLTKEFQVTIAVGNHDCYHGNTNSLNSPSLLLGEYENIALLDAHEPTVLPCSGTHIAIVPWMAASNWDRCIDFIKTTRCPHLFGHFDINGFEMAPGHLCTKGMEQSLFDRFDTVLSGHFHKKATIGNIHYLGTQYDMDWSDYGVPKGFHIFDCETGKIEFVENTDKIFLKIYWNDGTDTEAESCAGKFTKIIVESRGDEYRYQQYLSSLLANSPADLKIVESSIAVEQQLEDDVRLLSTVELLNRYVDTVEAEDADKKRASEIMNSLYSEVVSSAAI